MFPIHRARLAYTIRLVILNVSNKFGTVILSRCRCRTGARWELCEIAVELRDGPIELGKGPIVPNDEIRVLDFILNW